MKRYIIYIFIFVMLCNKCSYSQSNEVIALQSLEFLNKQLYLHLKKMNETVLITINNYKYVCNEYIEKDTLLPIYRLRFEYELKKVGERKYEFVLKVVSVYRGTFELIEENGENKYINLTYRHSSPPLISLPDK